MQVIGPVAWSARTRIGPPAMVKLRLRTGTAGGAYAKIWLPNAKHVSVASPLTVKIGEKVKRARTTKHLYAFYGSRASKRAVKIRDRCAKRLLPYDVLDVTDAEVTDPSAQPGEYYFDIQGLDFSCSVHVLPNLDVIIEDRDGVVPAEVRDCVTEESAK